MKRYKPEAHLGDASMRTIAVYGAGATLALVAVRACAPTWVVLEQVGALLANVLTIMVFMAVSTLILLVVLDNGHRAVVAGKKRWHVWWNETAQAFPHPGAFPLIPLGGEWEVPAMPVAPRDVLKDDGEVEYLPIIETRVLVMMLDPDPDVVPLVFVDVSHRPDVADLPRVQMSEGMGEMTTTWAVSDIPTRAAMVELICTYHRPVRTRYRVRFPLREKAAFVESISVTGQVGIALCVGDQVALGATRLLVEVVPFTGIAVDARTAQEIGQWVQNWRAASWEGGAL
jgi:hypothetical protein